MIAFAGVIPLLIAVLASTTLASADAHHYGDFASAASGNVRAVDELAESAVVGVAVPPDDVAADH